MANPKFRPVYLVGGFIGLVLLIYQIVTNLSDINPGVVLSISLPDMILFLLAYRTYPAEAEVEGQR